jgi:competence protein ComEC
MSFAATSALIAVFGALRTLEGWPIHPWMKPVLAVVLSSAIAGAATAPFAAAHFNQVSQFGLIANLLSVPLMGLVVIPSAVVAGVLTPFGLQDIALWVMGAGLRWILGVAHWISDLEGKGGAVPSPGEGVLALMSLGFIFLILWQGKTRAFGLIPVAVSLILWTQVSRPNVLIADSGGLVGVLTDQGRALSREKGQGFAAKNWLENDGDIATQKIAAERWDAQNPAGIRIAKVGDFSIIHVSGRKAAESFLDCAPSDIVIFSTPFEAELPCLSYDQTRLRETGSLAIYNIENQPQIITAREISGKRPWNSKPQN